MAKKKKNNLKTLWNKVKNALSGSSSNSKKKTTDYSKKALSESNKKKQSTSSSKKSSSNKSSSKNKKTKEAPYKRRKSDEYSSVNNKESSRRLLPEIETKTRSASLINSMDIAPVKKKKEDGEGIFKKPKAFEDGYDFLEGDVVRTAGSTVGDLGVGMAKGIGRLGEGLRDALYYGVSEVADVVGADNFANRVKVKAQENSIDNFFKDVEDGVEEYSVFGQGADPYQEGLGQVAGIILTGGIGAGAGLTSAGVTALTTGAMGVSSMGSGMSEAYQGGATDKEALAYGAIKGTVDAGTELIFGGLGKTVGAIGLSRGISSLDDAFALKLSSKISNQFAKNLVQYGVKASAEGSEEVLAGIGSAVGKKLTYMEDEELKDLIRDENLLEQFLVASVTSGIAQSGLVPGMTQGSIREANKAGRDFITGYTQNEQKVVDKVVENRIKEEEKSGKKLSNKDITKIKEEVETDLKKGYIDIDTIESTLGGETYKNYKSAEENETKLKEEYDTLNKMKQFEMTGEQIDRRAELKTQLDEMKTKSESGRLRSQLDSEIGKATEKDVFLRESYNEKSRRGQAFKADLNKYDAKQQEIIKKATESGILNNTNRTHEFVDMVAKISADKGVSFDFTSNEKLKESGFAIDGKTINGYIKDGNIAVNINSNKALNTVVGHEITHVLEGTELYTELQNAVKEYATTKGEYDTRYKALQGLYKDVDSAVLDNEVTADLIGDYLFTDSNFVNKLSAEKPNVFKKIYDEIKYLVKTVTGTKESRELAKVQKLFGDAYKSNSTSTKNDTSTYTTPEAKTLKEVDMEVDEKSKTVSYSLSSLEDAFKYNEGEVEYKNAREDYVQALMKSIGDTTEEGRQKAENYLNGMFLVHDMIARDRDRLDYQSAEGKSAWVSNAEYGGSIDFSTLCAKRRLFTGTFDAIQNALPDTVLTDKDYLEIRNLLLEHDQEAPCSMCYVEGSRAKHGTYVKKFLNEYLKTNPSWKPQIADFASTTRLEQTRIQHPEAYAEYVKAMNKLSQRKPKEASVRTDYKGEILKAFKDGDSVEQKNLNGGVRFNSFSDFEIIHTLDAMQVITDMSRVGLNGQAYTKVKEFAECFGNTGLKINLSLVAKDVDANGNLVYDEVNGMKHSEAMDLRNKYSDNVGTVIVVFNEAQMKSALANPEIDYVLPFHRSQWRKSQYTMMGLPTQTKDFTSVQNDRFRNPKTGRPKKVADGNIMPNEYWDFTKNGRENAQIYLDYINENNYIPKFDSVLEKVDGKYVLPEGAVGDGYFKLLIDFKMYNNDGVGIPQSPVMPEFNMPYIQQMLDDYKGGHHSFPVAHDVVEDFLKTKKGSQDVAPVKGNGVQYSLSDSDGNIKEVSTGYGYGETFFTMSYMQDGKEVGKLDYGEFDGEPNVKMIEVDPEYRRKGIGKKLLQQLQNKYPGVEISFGMTTPDGTKLIENSTYTVENEEVTGKLARIQEIKSKLDEYDKGFNNYFDNDLEIPEGYAEDYNDLYDEMVALQKEVRGKKGTKTFVKTDEDVKYSLGDDYAPLTEAEANERDAQQREALFTMHLNEAEKQARKDFGNKNPKEVLRLDSSKVKKSDRRMAIHLANIVDKGLPFENLAKKTKNRTLEAKWDKSLRVEAMAQELIGKGRKSEGIKPLRNIEEEIGSKGLTQDFEKYLQHCLNIDRMTLSTRFKGSQNKAVFGDEITADISREIVSEYEAEHPEFKQYAEDIYKIFGYLRGDMVKAGVMSEELSTKLRAMYPHYIPIKRTMTEDVVLEEQNKKEAVVGAPIKRAKGGNQAIEPLFPTLVDYITSAYRATTRNEFGLELMKTLGGNFEGVDTNVDEVMDSVDNQEVLLHKSENGYLPTFTVFENGKRKTFEITEEMYEALKPVDKGSLESFDSKILNKLNNVRRGLLTEYNPVFLFTNSIKDAQDVLINSQHPVKTYLNMGEAHLQILGKGQWYQEYVENGGRSNTYFDKETKVFKKDTGIKKVAKLPLNGISLANNYIETIPRLAEYIASRKAGRSIDVAMLDSARVTTNFKAGGDLTKMLNRNGVTFLNASVQGATQQVRNFREANMEGAKGWLKLAGKFVVAGLPAYLLNNIVWDDDEEYEQLSDYVKQNYYVVAKYGDGEFVRIPKGRTVAVIQEIVRQVSDHSKGDDEADLEAYLESAKTVFELAKDNIAPNNPFDNNLIAPITQALRNETWYGEDLVPSNLQDMPVREQYDESTDKLSRWISEKSPVEISPMKINYLLDQYSGGVGDLLLPIITPEAESGAETLGEYAIAPFKDKFTTDSVMNNQNVTDFYKLKEELNVVANGSEATTRDMIKSAYMDSVNSEMGALYGEKRDIQNSDLPNKEKYAKVKEIQKQIDALAENALASYEDISNGNWHGRVGDKEYKWVQYDYEKRGRWVELEEEELQRQNDAVEALGISANEYWTWDDRGSAQYAYDWAVENPGYYQVSRAISTDLMTYWKHNGYMYNNIRADKDENGETIRGSKKKKIIDYINTIDDLSYEEKLVLFKKYYPDDDTYNYEIIDYLNSRDDISYDEMETILEQLEFEVDSQGNITW